MATTKGTGKGGIAPPAASRFTPGPNPKRYVGGEKDTAVAALANRVNGLARSSVTTERLLQVLNDSEQSHNSRAAAAILLSLLGVDTGEKLKLTEAENRLLKRIGGKVRNAVLPAVQ